MTTFIKGFNGSQIDYKCVTNLASMDFPNWWYLGLKPGKHGKFLLKDGRLTASNMPKTLYADFDMMKHGLTAKVPLHRLAEIATLKESPRIERVLVTLSDTSMRVDYAKEFAKDVLGKTFKSSLIEKPIVVKTRDLNLLEMILENGSMFRMKYIDLMQFCSETKDSLTKIESLKTVEEFLSLMSKESSKRGMARLEESIRYDGKEPGVDYDPDPNIRELNYERIEELNRPIASQRRVVEEIVDEEKNEANIFSEKQISVSPEPTKEKSEVRAFSLSELKHKIGAMTLPEIRDYADEHFNFLLAQKEFRQTLTSAEVEMVIKEAKAMEYKVFNSRSLRAYFIMCALRQTDNMKAATQLIAKGLYVTIKRGTSFRKYSESLTGPGKALMNRLITTFNFANSGRNGGITASKMMLVFPDLCAMLMFKGARKAGIDYRKYMIPETLCFIGAVQLVPHRYPNIKNGILAFAYDYSKLISQKTDAEEVRKFFELTNNTSNPLFNEVQKASILESLSVDLSQFTGLTTSDVNRMLI